MPGKVILAKQFETSRDKLSGSERSRVADTVLRMMNAPDAPAFALHRVNASDFWSAKVTNDLRIILKKEDNGELVFLHVNHHDKAYLWARSHRLSRHPVTGSMQIVEIPEETAPVQTPPSVPGKPRAGSPAEALGLDEEKLLACGVPAEWTARVLAADAGELENLFDRLPAEAGEVILKIVEGVVPEPPAPAEPGVSAYETADARRSFVTFSDDESLRVALTGTWEDWTVFLHPDQRKVAYRDYSGPARVYGSAGTGKTVVALHHLKWLLERHPDRFVLLTTYSENLADDLNHRLPLLVRDPRTLERATVRDLPDFAMELYERIFGHAPSYLDSDEIETRARAVIERNRENLPKDLPPEFIFSEWERIVDVRDLRTWEAYRDAKRRNVNRHLSETRRRALWKVFAEIRADLEGAGLLSPGMLYGALTDWLRENPGKMRAFDHVIVDESQDLGEIELAFLAAYAKHPDTLFFAGDAGQRIKRYPFPWKDAGIFIQGRSRVLKTNYRTTREIRQLADRLMDESIPGPDEQNEEHGGTISVLRGAAPEFHAYDTPEDECAGVAAWLDGLKAEGVCARNIAIFFRDERQRERALNAIRASAYRDTLRNGTTEIRLGTMLDAKGLEYQCVAVIACDDDVIPSPERVLEGGFIVGIDEINETERNLLYVACTRARDRLLVTAGGNPSEFLLDMGLV